MEEYPDRFRIKVEEDMTPSNGLMITTYVIQEYCVKTEEYKDCTYHYGYSQTKFQKFFGLKTKIFERVSMRSLEDAQETIARFMVEEAPDRYIKFKRPKKVKDTGPQTGDKVAVGLNK